MSQSYQLNCKYEMFQISRPYGRLYSCRGLNYDAFCDNKDVSAVTGLHINHNNHQSVNQLYIDGMHSECIPSKLNSFFGRLQVLAVRNSLVSELHSDDLQGYTSLKTLDLHSNSIDKVPINFFDPTPNLEHVNLADNKIKYFEAKIFPKLNRLANFFMGKNVCIDKNAINDRELRELHALLKIQCKSESILLV